ncbi:MAG: Lrp/AsnC family transcriptional regulator [Sphingomonadales bacterium]|nr:Lrp/AsnC family transcriptional regulator [Sphingomonadales bacterium]MDE2170787.1 Lrp/AsnC family transcriptional regulator [Sphingomonadales bacterium]
MTNSVIDRFDRALLEQVQRNNLTPARVLAERVGLSESAVLRRLRRLRAEGIIAADVSIVRPEVLGRPLTVVVLVKLAREGRTQIERFIAAIGQRPEVVNIWYVTGEADFVLVAQVPDMSAYEEFTQDILLADANVESFTTMVAMRDYTPATHASLMRKA